MLTRLLKYATKNIFRNAFLSASSVLILTLLMFFINILLIVHDVSFRIISSVNERLTIALYLNEEYDKNSVDVIDLQNDLRDMIPGIDIRYKTKQEVLEDLRKTDPDLVRILERQNPLPETITLQNIPLNQYETLNTVIENKLYLLTESAAIEESQVDQEYFSTYRKQFERIEDVIGVLSVLQYGLYIIIATFVVSIAVIIYSIIGNFIYYYRDEIYITRLVGGSKLFIYGPFSLQGILYVLCAFSLSTILFFLFLANIRLLLGLDDTTVLFTGNFSFLFLIQLCVFVCIGGLSGFLSSRKYLQKR